MSIQEQRRKAFEEWALNEGIKTCFSHDHQDVMTPIGGACFAAWNAALDSVCVELPKGNSDMTVGALHMIVRCREAIHGAGIKTK